MRNQRRQEKISLSEDLEGFLYDRVLKKREIEALRERCESYQSGAPRPWSGDIYTPYALYFGLLSSLKIKATLQELFDMGYLDAWTKPPNIYDFGAGTMGATLGAIDFFKEKKIKVGSLYAFDHDKRPLEWATKEFVDFFPGRVKFEKPASLENTLLIAADVFNEMGLSEDKDSINPDAAWLKQILDWIENATPSTIIVLLEPASKFINRNFLTLRNLLSEKISILLPCTHQKSCPALLTDDWCHEEHAYKAPSAYWNLVKQIGFRRNMLQFSMLSLGKQPNKFATSEARIVSRPLKAKGRCEKWLCGDGKRWKASIMNRHRSETLEPFFEGCRGDVIDCHSTGIKSPD